MEDADIIIIIIVIIMPQHHMIFTKKYEQDSIEVCTPIYDKFIYINRSTPPMLMH